MADAAAGKSVAEGVKQGVTREIGSLLRGIAFCKNFACFDLVDVPTVSCKHFFQDCDRLGIQAVII